MIRDRIKNSLRERVRHYVKSHERDHLLSELGLSRNCPTDLETLEMLASVRAYLGRDIDLLVDVGAHKGHFAASGFHVLGARSVVCFEPNAELHPVLQRNLEEIKHKIYRYALSDEEGTDVLHIHDDSSMSSLLPADQAVLISDFATYDTQAIEEAYVQVSTLDASLSEYVDAGRRFFIKIDTQGNELAVLQGGQEVLSLCDGIVTEYMFTTPYEGQKPFEELTSFLSKMGFRCAAVVDMKRRKRTNRISGVDFLFLPTESLVSGIDEEIKV